MNAIDGHGTGSASILGVCGAHYEFLWACIRPKVFWECKRLQGPTHCSAPAFQDCCARRMSEKVVMRSPREQPGLSLQLQASPLCHEELFKRHEVTCSWHNDVSHLVICAVGAGDQFPVGFGSRKPGFQVVFLGCCIVELARHNVHDLVRELQGLVELHGIGQHLFKGHPRGVVIWGCHEELLHLLKLVYSAQGHWKTLRAACTLTGIVSEGCQTHIVMQGCSRQKLAKKVMPMTSKGPETWASSA